MNLIPWKRKKEADEEAAHADSPLARLRNEFDSMFDRLLHDPWGIGPALGPLGQLAGTPRTDLAETDTQVIVTVDLPGVDPKEVRIDLEGTTLTVRGERRAEREEKRRDYHYVERRAGAFMRRIQLPSTVDPDKIEASHKNGVLTVTIAKHPGTMPRRIEVRNA